MQRVIALYGPPASGKGTVASGLMSQGPDVYSLVQPGVMYRNMMAEGGDLGKEIWAHLRGGGICPSDLTNRIMLDAINKVEDGKIAILDGYPRDFEQLDFMKENFEVIKHVGLQASYDECLEACLNRRHCVKCRAVFSAKDTKSLYHLQPMGKYTRGMVLKPICGLPKTCECALRNKKLWETRWDDNEDKFPGRYATHVEHSQPLESAIRRLDSFAAVKILGNSLDQNTKDIQALHQSILDAVRSSPS